MLDDYYPVGYNLIYTYDSDSEYHKETIMFIPITYLLNIAYHRAKELYDAQNPNPVNVYSANISLLTEFSKVCADIDFIEFHDGVETFEMNQVDAINICELIDQVHSDESFFDELDKAAGQVIEAIAKTHSHRPIF